MKLSKRKLKRIIKEEVSNFLMREQDESVKAAYEDLKTFLINNGREIDDDLYKYENYLFALETMGMPNNNMDLFVSLLPADAYDTYQDVRPSVEATLDSLKFPTVEIQKQRGAVSSPRTERVEFEDGRELVRTMIDMKD